MSDTATAPKLAELAVVTRNGFVESRHFGTLVALDVTGATAIEQGDADAAILPRSTVKPVQALACLTAGAPLVGEHLAIAAGSHTGEDAHVAVVEEMLAYAGLDASALKCPADRPEDEASFERLLRQGRPRSTVRMNCSGKHAAMLWACAVNGWSTSDYLDPFHPLQRHIRDTVAELTGVSVLHDAIDGCGAPLFGSTVRGLARAFQGFVRAQPGSAKARVAEAMRAHPFFVGGSAHPNSDLMRTMPGALAKGGAEGVIGVAAGSGAAVSMKIIDGSPRATTMIALRVLEALGEDVSGVGALMTLSVLGGGVSVGSIEPGNDLCNALAEGGRA